MTDKLPPVAILAGGLAKRLRPITESIPKALAPVNGTPFILLQLERLRAEGITQVVCCVGYQGKKIEETIGDGKKWDLQISYSYDGEKLLGTGGAIKKAITKLGNTFFVLYGDSFLQVRYRAVKEEFDRQGKKGLLTIFENRGQWDTSNLEYRENRIIAYSKKNRTPGMRHIDYGLSLLKSKVFEDCAEGVNFDLADLYERLVLEDELAPFVVTERFYEIGSPQGLEEFEKWYPSACYEDSCY